MRITLPKHFPALSPKRRRLLLVGCALLTVAVICGFSFLGSRPGTQPQLSDSGVTVLQYADLADNISASGTVESAATHKIYSSLNYPVAEVRVEIGDAVTADTVLCKLDSSTLEKQLRTKEASLAASTQSAQQQVKTAQDSYDAAKDALDSGKNTSVISAQSSFDSSYDSYQSAQDAYDNYKNQMGKDSNLLGLDAAMNAAKEALVAAQQLTETAGAAAQAAREAAANYADGKSAEELAADATYQALLADCDVANQRISDCEGDQAAAQAAYDSAAALRNAAYASANQTLSQYEDAMDSANARYKTARKSYAATKDSAESSLQSSYNSVVAAELGTTQDVAKLELAQLRQDIEDTNIMAGVEGTVTAVYATVGGSGSGLLFVIEDTASLEVATSVKEYDVGSVVTGMPVSIKSNATGDAVFAGEVLSIAPTSGKNAQGNTEQSSDAVFSVRVRVKTADTALRIGMNVHVSYLLVAQENALAVPYDAVYRTEAGQSGVLCLEAQESGEYIVREQVVTTGAETDLLVAIGGDGVEAGMLVINEPDSYRQSVGKSISFTPALPMAASEGAQSDE